MKIFMIICLTIGLLYSIYQNQVLLYDVAIMNWALDTAGKAYQGERHMLLACRAK